MLLGFVLLPWSLLPQVCFSLGFWLKPFFVNDPSLDLLLHRSLAWNCSFKVLWLLSTPSEFSSSGAPRTAENLAHVTPSEVPDSCLKPHRFLVLAYSL